MDRSTRRALIEQLARDGERLAADFGLRYRAIEAEPTHVRSRYGVCYADGTIRIRLRHACTGRPLKYSSLVNTLCHELAHLRHFNHGPRFKALYLRILEHARARGIYRPAARGEQRNAAAAPAARPPVLRRETRAGQLELFPGLADKRR
jgi:predicted metal-dependent hydrolase